MTDVKSAFMNPMFVFFFNYNVLSKVEPVEDDATIDDRRLCKLEKNGQLYETQLKFSLRYFIK